MQVGSIQHGNAQASCWLVHRVREFGGAGHAAAISPTYDNCGEWNSTKHSTATMIHMKMANAIAQPTNLGISLDP